MIASSLREGDDIVDILLRKDADATMKSELLTFRKPSSSKSLTNSRLTSIAMSRFQWSSRFPYIIHLHHDHNLSCSAQTALHFTASKNNLETARKLISHRALARVKDKRSQLPLHRAAAIGSVPMVKLMLENKSPVNATDVSGLTALHHGELFGLLIAIHG